MLSESRGVLVVVGGGVLPYSMAVLSVQARSAEQHGIADSQT